MGYIINNGIKYGASSGIDYIVEQGVSGIWTYRKWNSGLAECWGTYEFQTAVNTAWGSIYESGQIQFPNYPFTFTELPIVLYSHNASDNAYIIEGGDKRGTQTVAPPAFWIARGVSTSSATYKVSAHTIGKWK